MRTGPHERPLASACIALLACMAGAGAATSPSPAQPAEVTVDNGLREEIEALVLNVWDQKMARQFQMELELPRAEVQARFDVFSRWLDAIRSGALRPLADGPPGTLAAELIAEHRELASRLESDPALELDRVLIFLEHNVQALQDASGIHVEPPM